jgi:DNA-binding response OmpR family regulator
MENAFIVEDDFKIAKLLSDYLLQVNFSVTIFADGDKVVAEIKKIILILSSLTSCFLARMV